MGANGRTNGRWMTVLKLALKTTNVGRELIDVVWVRVNWPYFVGMVMKYWAPTTTQKMRGILVSISCVTTSISRSSSLPVTICTFSTANLANRLVYKSAKQKQLSALETNWQLDL